MKFCHSTLHVRNMEESLAFYEGLIGLPVTRRFASGMGEIAFLGGGDTEVELIADDPTPAKIPNISWGFETPSLEEALARVQAAGVPVHSGPFSPAPGVRFFFVRDPNGLLVQLIEHRAG